MFRQEEDRAPGYHSSEGRENHEPEEQEKESFEHDGGLSSSLDCLHQFRQFGARSEPAARERFLLRRWKQAASGFVRAHNASPVQQPRTACRPPADDPGERERSSCPEGEPKCPPARGQHTFLKTITAVQT